MLCVEDTQGLFPLPSFTSALSEVSDMKSQDRDLILENENVLMDELCEYRKSVIHIYMALFNLVSTRFNGLNGRQNKALNAGEVAAVEFFNSHIEEVRNDLNALK